MPEYSKIISRSIEIVKKNKWLWVYGALVSAGGSSFSNSGFRNSSSDLFKNSPKNIEDAGKYTSQVLGTATNYFTEWAKTVSPLSWVLLILGIILLAATGMVIKLILDNWVKGSLIAGTQMALNDEEVDLKNTSPSGIKTLKPLVIFQVRLLLYIVGLTIAGFVLGIVLYSLFKAINLVVIAGILIAIAAITYLAVFVIYLPAISIYGERLVVLTGSLPKPAIIEAIKLTRKNFMTTVVMGLVNSVITGIGAVVFNIGLLILLGIPAFFTIYPNIKNQIVPNGFQIIFLILLILIFLNANLVLGAVINVFKYSNWNQIFGIIKTDNKNE